MKFKMKIKVVIDLFMTILLLLLMTFQITGQEFHEWFGAGMLVLFLAPQSELAEGLAVSYSGGSSLSDDIAKWLEKNGVKK